MIMKKNILYILAAVLAVPMLSSCNEWLEEHPKAIAVDTFYNTESDAEAAIEACVMRVRNVRASAEMSAFMECFADYNYGRGSWQANSTYDILNEQNKNRVTTVWINTYRIIRDANICISKFPGAKNLSDEQKTQYIAEAKFFRALAYFDIARFWGKGVLRTEENLETWNLPMSPVEDIWNLVISDLKYAVENCPDKAKQLGRPGKNAARTLLAHVYLTRKEYNNAAPLLKAVIDSKEYSLVKVSTHRDFDNLFGHENVISPEEIFYVKTSRTGNQGWQIVMYYAHPNARKDGMKMSGAGGWFALSLSMSNKWVQNWDTADLRREYCILEYPGQGNFGDVVLDGLTTKFIDPDAASADGNCDNPMYRYADVLMMYAEALSQGGSPNAEAMECVNMIHRRAYGHDPMVASADDYVLSDYSTKDKFMELIVKEQCYEFWGETKRWPFLVRTGLAEKYVKEYKGRTINPNLYLFPIPENEFLYNEALDPVKDQNPGY